MGEEEQKGWEVRYNIVQQIRREHRTHMEKGVWNNEEATDKKIQHSENGEFDMQLEEEVGRQERRG